MLPGLMLRSVAVGKLEVRDRKSELPTIAVSGKILCLSVTHFCVACHSATVGEIDTKPVLYATPVDVSNIEIIVGRSRSRSLLGVTQLFVSGLYLKNYLINTNVVCYACSSHLGRVSRINFGDLANCSRSFFLVSISPNLPPFSICPYFLYHVL